MLNSNYFNKKGLVGQNFTNHTLTQIVSFQIKSKGENMLKYFTLYVLFATAVIALPTLPPKPNRDADVSIIKNYNEDNPDGSYKWGYETSNGIKQEQSSYLKYPGTENEIRVVIGSYSYPLDDGRTLTVNYISDENGYRPTYIYSP